MELEKLGPILDLEAIRDPQALRIAAEIRKHERNRDGDLKSSDRALALRLALFLGKLVPSLNGKRLSLMNCARSVQNSSLHCFCSCPHFDVVLRKLVSEQQGCS